MTEPLSPKDYADEKRRLGREHAGDQAAAAAEDAYILKSIGEVFKVMADYCSHAGLRAVMFAGADAMLSRAEYQLQTSSAAWDAACVGCTLEDEQSSAAALREAAEELGA